MRTIRLNETGQRIGQDHPNAKLTDAEVELVHRLREDGMGIKTIAKTMETPLRTIRTILSGARRCCTVAHWKTIED